MSTKNVTLHDENGNVLLPATKTSRITDADGTNLDALLDAKANATDVSTNTANITTLTGDVENLKAVYDAITQSNIVVVESADWPVATPTTNTIYRVTGTTSYSDYMYNGSNFVEMATYNNAIDPTPTIGSDNLVKSGGIAKELALGAVYDVSAHNNNATFTSLSALLSDANLSTLIPADVRKGGMSVKFVQSSDNEYVQYRLMANVFSSDTNDWAFCGDDVYTENPEYVRVVTDAKGRILYGVKTDGDFFFGIGVPQSIKDYVLSQKDDDGDVLAEKTRAMAAESALGTAISNEVTRATSVEATKANSVDVDAALDNKVDKEEGKGLISTQYISKTDNPEYVYVMTDNEDKILFCIKVNGEPYFGVGCPEQVKEYIEQKIADLSLDEYEDAVTFLSDYLGGDATLKSIIDNLANSKVDKAAGKSLIDAEYAEGVSQVENSEFVRVVTDANDKILYGVKKNGDFYFGAGVPSIIQESLIGLDEKLNSEIGILTTQKVSKEEGKSLINTDFADGISVVDSSEIVDIKLDGEGRIVELTKKDGTKVFYSGLEVKGDIHSEPVNLELKNDVNFVSVKIDAKGRIISAKTKDGENFPKKKENQIIPQYPKLLDAMRDDCYKPFLLGSQLVQANTSVYDKELGLRNTFNADKLIKQFNYIGLDGKLPNMKMGRLQKIMIGDVQATILYMGTYIYAVTDGNGIVYRMPYSKLSIITENNTDIDSISIPLDNKIIDGVYETNDGNFLIQVYDSTSPDTYPIRSLYKVTLDGGLNATVSAEPVIVCVQSTTNIVGVREHWSFKQYGAMILISPYGTGRTGQLWLSRDYGNSFDCIFNVVNDTTYVATKPNGQGGYGAYGIHPLPSQMLPPQGDDFWNNVSNIGNGSKHVHSICYDEEFERIWLVTGDDKYLATGIYWSDDMGKTWHRKSLVFNYPDIDCGTTTQMLQVVSMKNCVLFGTDGWGNGIFRYNRGKKEDEPILEFVFGWDADRDNLYGIASHNIVTSDGIMLMVFAANSNAALPRGGVVASDGYHFRKIFIDTYCDGVTLASQKIGWPSFLSVNNDNLYIRTKAKNEIIIIEKFNS